MDDHTLRIIVAEDEIPAREEILHLLGESGKCEVLGTAGDGQEALDLIRKLKPDLALLDIEMPGMSGIEVARHIIDENLPVRIIFTTAYEQFAIQAFDVSAVDYLLKPIRQEKLSQALEKVIRLLPAKEGDRENLISFLENYMKKDSSTARFISIYQGDSITPVPISTIHFAEAKGRFVWVTTEKGEFKTTLNFRQAEERLKEPEFFTCHRSFIIRPESVESIDLWINSSYRLKMKGSETTVPVSRSRKEAFKELMGL